LVPAEGLEPPTRGRGLRQESGRELSAYRGRGTTA